MFTFLFRFHFYYFSFAFRSNQEFLHLYTVHVTMLALNHWSFWKNAEFVGITQSTWNLLSRNEEKKNAWFYLPQIRIAKENT